MMTDMDQIRERQYEADLRDHQELHYGADHAADCEFCAEEAAEAAEADDE